MKKRVIKFICIVILSILAAGCEFQRVPQEPPDLTVTIGDKEVQYVCAKNKWNGAVYDREDTFKSILKKGSGNEIPFIEIGETAVIDFKKLPPDQFTIYDILVNEKGEQIYTDRERVKIPVELKHGRCTFKIEKNLASGLSSFYVENKKDIRGFRMLASWGNNECEYAFVIKTDAY
jgi:hypothetical protein